MRGLALLLDNHRVVFRTGSRPSTRPHHDSLGRQGHCYGSSSGKKSVEQGGGTRGRRCGAKGDPTTLISVLQVAPVALSLQLRRNWTLGWGVLWEKRAYTR